MTVLTNRDARALIAEALGNAELGPAARHYLEGLLAAANFHGDVPSVLALISTALFAPHELDDGTRQRVDESTGLYSDVSLLGRITYGIRILSVLRSSLVEDWDADRRRNALRTRNGSPLRVVAVPDVAAKEAAAHCAELREAFDLRELDMPQPLR